MPTLTKPDILHLIYNAFDMRQVKTIKCRQFLPESYLNLSIYRKLQTVDCQKRGPQFQPTDWGRLFGLNCLISSDYIPSQAPWMCECTWRIKPIPISLWHWQVSHKRHDFRASDTFILFVFWPDIQNKSKGKGVVIVQHSLRMKIMGV